MARRRVGAGRGRCVGLLGRPAVEPEGGITIAAPVGPARADQPKDGAQWRQLRQDLFKVHAQRPQEQAHVVPPGAGPVRVVVAHAVHLVRHVEQLWVSLEHAVHAELGLDRLYVVDALDPAVVPEQVSMLEEAQDAPELVHAGERDADVDGGVHVGAGIEQALPDLAVEQL